MVLATDSGLAQDITIFADQNHGFMPLVETSSGLLDFSDSTKRVFLTSNGTLVVDALGIHFTPPDCSIQIDITAADLVNLAAANPAPRKRAVSVLPRAVVLPNVYFNVELSLLDGCGNMANTLSPVISLDTETCSPLSGVFPDTINYRARCAWFVPAEKQCEANYIARVDTTLTGDGPSAMLDLLPIVLKILAVGSAALVPLVGGALVAGIPFAVFLITFSALCLALNEILGYMSAFQGVAILNKAKWAQSECQGKFPIVNPLALSLSVLTEAITLASLSDAPNPPDLTYTRTLQAYVPEMTVPAIGATGNIVLNGDFEFTTCEAIWTPYRLGGTSSPLFVTNSNGFCNSGSHC